MHTLILIAFLQSPEAVEPVRSVCSRDAPVIISVGAHDQVEVEMAMAGEVETCYKITLVRPQGNIKGYVLGDALPAVAAFVEGREKTFEESAAAEARMLLARSASKTLEKQPAKSTDPLISTQFEDFSGRDSNGKPVALSNLKGRVIIVSFWSPKSGQSQSQLTSVMPLYNQFHKRGLDAVGISMDPSAGHILTGLDDITPAWPQIPDRNGLAARYQVNPKVGKIFVLDSSHRIVAAGQMAPEMERKILDLLGAPP
jgi:hypothetical protein